ncbi:glyoxalase superfamily protein [Aureimonas pseudogalii]|uniref:Catechol 2,3-dioxygenase-like lactoylglutathione lyase family enzyme n=1 Tax=Aureimonas pseudogalii TaxID=1744844 RepID=A0A7W6H7R0_9HYPH|nr:glyoxalase superfamily protein [Aureimonas pseudogalii]MBB4000129.1 catechol 2,3-dioxygenase-like lactoylglutathione lyase family enzyme [Aureimonas pseudogalii]
MPTIDQAKSMAKRLRSALATKEIDVSHATSLELVAVELGYRDWNTASAVLEPERLGPVLFEQAIPILRIFDVPKAREFYCGFLGFGVTMEHRHEPGLPLYMAIERAGLELHLSEHHGDASPGSTAFVWTRGIQAYHAELTGKAYGYGRPAIERLPWGDQLQVHDPFGNRVRFCERRT